MNELPRGWTTTTLEAICEKVEKNKPSDRPDEPFQYVDIGGIENQRIIETKGLLGRDAPSRARQLVRAGDTVLSTVRTYLRKTALIPDALDGATASTGFCVLRPAAGIESAFVFYRVIEDEFVAELSALQTGSSYPAVRDLDVLRRSIFLPPSNEQRRIVAAIEEQLSRLDAAEASLRRALRNVTRLRECAVAAAMPRDAEVRTVEELTHPERRCAYGVLQPGPHVDDGVPLVRVSDIRDGVVGIGDLKQISPAIAERYPRTLLRGGEVLLTLVGSIGRSAVVPDQLAGANVARAVGVIPVIPGVSPEYVSLALGAVASREPGELNRA